jgi:hypothetical protein
VPDIVPDGAMHKPQLAVPPKSNLLDIVLNTCVSWVERLREAAVHNQHQWFEVIRCVEKESGRMRYIRASGGPYETEILNTSAKNIVKLIEKYDTSIDHLIDRSLDGNAQKSVCRCMLETVLHPGITDWDIGQATSEFITELMIMSFSSLPDIQRLTMSEQTTTACKWLLLNNIHKLKNLQEFHFEFGCFTELLTELGKHCTRLKKLFINSSKNVDDSSLIDLMKLEEMVILDVSETAITPKGYGMILSHLKHLENIKWSGLIDDVLTNIAKERLSAVTTMDGTLRNIGIVIDKCPLIKKLCVVKAENDMAAIQYLVAMAELTIVSCDASTINLAAMLQGISTGLTFLDVGNVTNMNIEHVIKHASLLEKLTVTCCKFNQSSGSLFDSKLPHFRSLEFLELTANQWYGDFHSYLKCYVHLKVFIAINTPELDDTAVETVVKSKGFQELEEFSAVDCGPLGKTAAYFLIKLCGKLTRIRGVRTWSGLATKDDMDYVLGMARSVEVPVTVEM